MASFNRAAVTKGWAVRAMLAAGAVGVILFFAGRIYTASVDVGWHYSLIDFIVEHASLPNSGVTYLGPMVEYPPGAHLLTAAVTAILGMNILQTMFLGSITTIFAFYFIILCFLDRGNPEQYSILAGSLIFLLLLLRPTQMLLGNEIIGNFFYAQLIGDLAFLSAFLVASRLRQPILRFLFAFGAVQALAWVFTASAAKFALAICLLELLALARERTQERMLTASAMILALPLTIVSHPTFIPMMRNAAHDGSISVGLPLVLFGSALLLGLSAASLLCSFHRRPPLFSERLAVAGFGVGLLAWAQFGCWNLAGLGSLYAVKKHGFMAGTLLAAVLAPLLASILGRTGLRRHRLKALVSSVPTFSVRWIAACLAVVVVLPWRGEPLAAIIQYDSELRSLVASGRPPDVLGHTISVNNRFTPGINFALAITVLQLNAWSPAGVDQAAVFGMAQSTASTVRYAVTILPQEHVSPQCVVESGADSRIRLIRRSCLPLASQITSDGQLLGAAWRVGNRWTLLQPEQGPSRSRLHLDD